MHCNEHSPFLSTNSASSLIGSGNGSAAQFNAIQSKYGLSPSFPPSRYDLPTFSTKKGIGCTSGQNLLAPSHQCNPGPTWIALSFFAFYNCLCNHASTKASISRGTCYISIKYLALWLELWVLNFKFGIESQYWEYRCLSMSIYTIYWCLSMSIYPFGLFSGHWATLLTEADPESVSLLFVCPTICLYSRRENNSTINYASLSGKAPNKFSKPKFGTLTPPRPPYLGLFRKSNALFGGPSLSSRWSWP